MHICDELVKSPILILSHVMPYLFPLENYDCSLPFFQEVSNVSIILSRKLKFGFQSRVWIKLLSESFASRVWIQPRLQKLDISRATVYRALFFNNIPRDRIGYTKFGRDFLKHRSERIKKLN